MHAHDTHAHTHTHARMHAPAITGAMDWDSDDEHEIGVMVVSKDVSTNKRQHKHMHARSTSFTVRPLHPSNPSQAPSQRHEPPTAETSPSVERGNAGLAPQFVPSIEIGTIRREQINLRSQTPQPLESSTLPPITLVGGDLIYCYNGKPSPVKGGEQVIRGGPHAQPSSVPSDQLEAHNHVLGAQPDEQKLNVHLRPSRFKRIGGGGGDTAGEHEIMAPSFEPDSNELPKPVREWTRIVGDDAENGESTALPAPIREWTEIEDRKQSDKASTRAEHELRSGRQGPDTLPLPAFSFTPPAGTSHAWARTQARTSPALQARMERARQLHDGGGGSAGGPSLHARDGRGAAGPRAVAGRWVDPARGQLTYREPTPMVAHLPLLSTSVSQERSDRPGSPDKEGLGAHAEGSRRTSVPLSTVENWLQTGMEGRGRSHDFDGCDDIWIADAVEGGDDIK